MAQLDVQRSGRIGFRALTYYSITTILAAIVGIAMVLMIHPGDPQIKTAVAAVVKAEETKVSTVDAILDIIRYGKAVSMASTISCPETPHFSFSETWCRRTWCKRASSRFRPPT